MRWRFITNPDGLLTRSALVGSYICGQMTGCDGLELTPEKLVVDVVVELHL